ncbi:hypothetical protein BurJ1DRAFT_2611 [Burkholderiales bacterium JOSHI_001]|nr:hypothetical protein BurJ1DRAFT_2611 [Burkholderiales bacterium JOSHI_001]
MNERLQDLLPWYANGRISAADRAWVDEQLAVDPLARAQLAWHRSLRERMQEAAPAVSDSIGLDQAMSRIRADKQAAGGGWAERLTAWLGLRPGVALAGLALVALQGGFILHLMNEQKEAASEIRAVRAIEVEERPMLKLNFAPDAKESDIRMLLMSVQGRLAGGPGQLGDYYVVVPDGKEDAAAEQLRANPIVQAVSLAPGLPPRE